MDKALSSTLIKIGKAVIYIKPNEVSKIIEADIENKQGIDVNSIDEIEVYYHALDNTLAVSIWFDQDHGNEVLECKYDLNKRKDLGALVEIDAIREILNHMAELFLRGTISETTKQLLTQAMAAYTNEVNEGASDGAGSN